MPQVKYTGGHDEVVVPAFGITAVRDQPVDVSDDQAEQLTLQSDWEIVESKTTKTSKDDKKGDVA